MIFTFYSYKGGVGRSMAMASVAHLMARRGLRVLAIDFDLEAPGLERYFFDGERSKAVREQPGLIDLILAYRHALSDEAAFASGDFKRWRDFRLTAINVAGSLGGAVDLMTAGKREPESAKRDYALAVRSFDWQDFFYNWKGDLFFDWLRRQLRNIDTGYDVVLVDSRTGVTEMGGVCAYQLADVAVLLCAPNYQNLDGTLDVVRDFRSESVRALRRGRPLEILALPARLEPNHPGRAAFLALFKEQLGVEGLPAALAAVGLDYESLSLPYLPQFAVAEQLVGEAPPENGQLVPVVDVFERLTDALTLLAEPGTPLGRQRDDALVRLTGGSVEQAVGLVADTTKTSAGYDAFIDCSRADLEIVRELVTMLERAGHRSFLDTERIEVGQTWQSAMEQALAYSSVLLLCFGQPADTELRARTIAQARRLQTVKIIPVLLPGSDERALASFDLSLQQTVDLRDWTDEVARGRLLGAMAAAVGRASHSPEQAAVSMPERDPYPGARAFGEDDAAFFVGREREVETLVDALCQDDIVLLTGSAQVGKTSLIQAGLLPRLRRMGEREALQFDNIDAIDLARTPEMVWQERWDREDVSSLLLIDSIDSFDLDGSAAARAARFADVKRFIVHARKRCKIVLVARDAWPPPERAAVMGLLHERRAAIIEVHPLAGEALRHAMEEPARRAAHLLEPGLAERLIESAGTAHSAIAQIQLALATIWPERKRGWLTNKNLDAAGHLGGIVAQRRRTTLEALSPAESGAVRVFFSRLVALSSTYAIVTSPQPWDSLSSVPAIERVDAVALRDRLAGAGLIDLYNTNAVGPQNDAPPRELQVALTRPDVSVYLSEGGSTPDLRFLLWRDPLSSLAARWDSSNADAMLRGSALAEAQHWLADRVDQLTRKEREFIDASAAAQQSEAKQRRTREDNDRAVRRSRLFFAGLAWLSTAALAVIVFLLQLIYQSQSGKLANMALTSVDQDPARGARLAHAAIEKDPDNVEAEVALRQSMARLEVAHTVKIIEPCEFASQSSEGKKNSCEPIADVRYTKDGTRLLVASGKTVTVFDAVNFRQVGTRIELEDKVVQAWLTNGNQTLVTKTENQKVQIQQLGHAAVRKLVCPDDQAVWAVASSKDDKHVAIGCQDGEVLVWDTTENAEAPKYSFRRDRQNSVTIMALSFSTEGNFLSSGDADGRVSVWKLGHPNVWIDDVGAASKSAASKRNNRRPIRDVQFLESDSHNLVTTGDDKQVTVWYLNLERKTLTKKNEKNEKRHWVLKHERPVTSAKFFPVPQGQSNPPVVTVSGKVVQVWHGEDSDPKQMHLHDSWVLDASPSPDGEFMVTASADALARIWSTKSGKVSAVLRGHRGSVNRAFFSPKGDAVLTAGDDGSVRVWQFRPPTELAAFGHWALDATFDPKGELVAIADEKGTACVTAVDASCADSKTKKLMFGQGTLQRLSWSRDSKHLAGIAITNDSFSTVTPMLWEIADKGHRGEPDSAAFKGAVQAMFRAGGDELLSLGYEDRQLGLWDATKLALPDVKPLLKFGSKDLTRSLASISPDGQWIAAAVGKGMELWHRSGKQVVPVKIDRQHRGAVMSLRFSGDSTRLISASEDRTALIWTLAALDKKPIELSGGHTGPLSSAAFDRTGQWVVTGSADGTIAMWRATSGQKLAVLPWHSEAVNSVEFSPKDGSILSASDDGTVRLGRCESCTMPLPELKVNALQMAKLSKEDERDLQREIGGLTAWAGSLRSTLRRWIPDRFFAGGSNQ